MTKKSKPRLPRPYKAKAWPHNDKIKAKKKTLKAIASVVSLPRNDGMEKVIATRQ